MPFVLAPRRLLSAEDLKRKRDAEERKAAKEERRKAKAAAEAAGASAAVAPKPAAVPVTPIAFLFPGQGSQAVGMLKESQGLPEVKKMLQAAREVLGYDLLQLCNEGPKEKLDDTIYSQVSLFLGQRLGPKEPVLSPGGGSMPACLPCLPGATASAHSPRPASTPACAPAHTRSLHCLWRVWRRWSACGPRTQQPWMAAAPLLASAWGSTLPWCLLGP